MGLVTLVLGGARSGKSSWAEHKICNLSAKTEQAKIYVATCEPFDDEMQKRVAKHQHQRQSANWRTLESPTHLAESLQQIEDKNALILVDCLTVWMGNIMHYGHDVAQHREQLLGYLQTAKQPIFLVANEVGLGIVPDSSMARRFRDESGILHQKIAAIADNVVWMVAGIPTYIKGAENI